MLLSIVTAWRAKALPCRLAAVFIVMLEYARIFPMKADPVPSVAPLPTCQNTFPGRPLLRITTDELVAVVSVLATWNTQIPLGLPRVSRTSCPVNSADDVKQ